METKTLVKKWFDCWENGDFQNLPISEDFKHTSPFGTIDGKKAYEDLVAANKDKFLGHTFEIHDGLYEENHACVRYTSRQGEFKLDASEWYYIEDGLINRIVSYYHMGEIRSERKIDNY